MEFDLLQIGYLITGMVYAVSTVTLMRDRRFSLNARIICSAVCLVLCGACVALSTVSETVGAFVVGIFLCVLSLVEAMRHFGEMKKLRGTGYLAMAVVFAIALIKHNAFN